FGQQRHGVHQVLQSDDSDQKLIVDDGNDAEIARGELAEGGGERLLLGGDVENAVHDRLHVAIAFGAQRFENFLPGDNANHVAAAHYWKIVLQGVHGFFKRVFQRIGGREGSKVSEHDFFQPDALQHRLKYRRALFELRAHEEEESDHHQPPVAHQHSDHHEHDGKDMADADGALSSLNHVNAAQEKGTQNAAAVHGIRRQQIEQAEVEVRPDDAPQQGARVEKRLRGKRKTR